MIVFSWQVFDTRESQIPTLMQARQLSLRPQIVEIGLYVDLNVNAHGCFSVVMAAGFRSVVRTPREPCLQHKLSGSLRFADLAQQLLTKISCGDCALLHEEKMKGLGGEAVA